ncbi:MAG: hypothetical protein R3282_02450, partial [Rhodothermales bacterium]|nr:hypothetical protein [Rhodothermales bacterium]
LLASARAAWRLTAHHSVTAVSSVARLLNDELGSSSYWTREGWRVDDESPVSVDQFAREGWLGYLDVSWRIADNDRWFELSLHPRAVLDGSRELRTISRDRTVFVLDERILASSSGGSVSVSGAAAAPIGDLKASVYLDRRIRFGDRTYRSIDRTLPTTSARAGIDYAVSGSFWLAAVVWYFSGTSWDEYAAAAADTELYRSRLPAFTRLDVTGTKGFFDNRLDFSVTIRNVFGRRVVLHPIGANLDRALTVRLRLSVN